MGKRIVIGLSSRFCFQHRQSGFYLIVSDGVINRVGKKWKCFNSSDSDSIALMTADDSDLLFSLRYKRFYDSAYDSDYDSVASENQP